MMKKIVSGVMLLFLALLTAAPVLANDPYEDDQWYLDQINVRPAWDITTGNDEIVVAVLDTGVDMNHPDLVDNLWTNPNEISGDGRDNDNNGFIDDVHGWNFIYDSNDPEPHITSIYSVEAVKHGTFVAGLISAVHDNNVGIKGVTAKVKIMPLVVLNAAGFGTSTSVSDAIHYAIDNGADVINLSFGGSEHYSALKSAIVRAYDNNVTVVAAAGNSISGGLNLAASPVYPICYDNDWELNAIIGVAATDEDNQLSGYSNYGGGCIDIVAPGDNITSLAFYNNEFSDFSTLVEQQYMGTSFSTALVSGTVALMKSINPTFTTEQVAEILASTAVNLDSINPDYVDQLGAGLLDAAAAVTETYNQYNVENRLKFYISADENHPAAAYEYDVTFRHLNDIEVFGSGFIGLNLQSGDLNADGVADLVTAAKPGQMPFVRGISSDKVLLSSFLAFEDSFRGGVRADAGDVDNDGQIEYVVVPEKDRAPVVRVFDHNGKLQTGFKAFDRSDWFGLSVAVGDVTGDSRAEIVVGAPKGSTPEVKIFDSNGHLLKTLLVYGSNFTGGVNVALGAISGRGYDDIIVGAGFGGGPHVRAFSYDGSLRANFFAYNDNFRGGVRVAAGDFNLDGYIDIITAPGKTGGPHVRIYTPTGNMLGEFFALSADYTGGIQVAVGE
ncbi:TPA: hypothetical protein DF272_01250 [Candidatus Falkowbacteria bacterium]|nr:hypothetical protein [Candidatus Falkowbacteria bacterium]